MWKTASRQDEFPSGSGVTRAISPCTMSLSHRLKRRKLDDISTSVGHHSAVGQTGTSTSASASGSSRSFISTRARKPHGGLIQFRSRAHDWVNASAASTPGCL